MTPPEPKPEHKLWANVTILAAVIGCIGVLSAALITIVPDILNQSKNISAPGGTQQPTEVISGTPVFSADFENGSTDNFTVDLGNWSVVDDGTGNKVLESATQTDKVSTIEFAPSDLNNFVVEYRVKLKNYSAQEKNSGGHSLQFRKTPETYYTLLFDQTTPDISFDYVSNSGWNWTPVIGKPFSLESDIWYDVKVESKGDELKAYVNGVLYLTISDSRLKNGNFALSVGTTTVYQFDNIKIWSLP